MLPLSAAPRRSRVEPIEDARQRFGVVHTALASDPDPCEITVGFAALARDDDAAQLIERADADPPSRRGRGR